MLQRYRGVGNNEVVHIPPVYLTMKNLGTSKCRDILAFETGMDGHRDETVNYNRGVED